jgi:hypothetical protein
LHKKLSNAYSQSSDHQERFDRFSDLQSRDIPEWEKMVKAWDKDHSQRNPYTATKSGDYALCSPSVAFKFTHLHIGVTEADVKLALASHEAELAAKGIPALHDKISASAFIVAGLDLQEQQ